MARYEHAGVLSIRIPTTLHAGPYGMDANHGG